MIKLRRDGVLPIEAWVFIHKYNCSVIGLTAWWKFGKWRRKGEIRKKTKSREWLVGKAAAIEKQNKKTTLLLNNWNSNLDVRRRKKKKRGEKKKKKKKKDFFYSPQNTSVPKTFPETATMPQGIANAFCHHSHPLKCTLDTTERKLGQRKNETKQNQSIAHQRKDSFFSWSSKEWCVPKTNQFSLPTCTTHTHTCADTLTQASGLVVGIHFLNNHFCK